jgi:hypothetical protein
VPVADAGGRAGGARFSGRVPLLTLCAASFLTIIVVAVGSSRPLLYDEIDYVAGTVRQLNDLGPGRTFLLEYPHPAGILFGVLHWVLEPITALLPPLVRIVNPLLLVATMALTAGLCRCAGARAPWESAAAMVCIPMVWVLTGLALTELSGMVLAALGLSGFVTAPDRRSTAGRLIQTVLSGMAFGAAFYSRPPLAAVAATACVFPLNRSRSWRDVAVFFAGGAALVLPTVLLWGGLVPPTVDFYASSSFSVEHMLLALGYGGVVMGLLCPAWYDLPPGLTVGLIVGAMLLNVVIPVLEIEALMTAARRVLPDALMTVYARLAGGLCLGAGGMFVVATWRRLREHRQDAIWLAVTFAMLLLVLSVGKITHQFSSRYVGVAAPFMAAAAARYRRFDAREIAGAGVGAALGAISLLSYHSG